MWDCLTKLCQFCFHCFPNYADYIWFWPWWSDVMSMILIWLYAECRSPWNLQTWCESLHIMNGESLWILWMFWLNPRPMLPRLPTLPTRLQVLAGKVYVGAGHLIFSLRLGPELNPVPSCYDMERRKDNCSLLYVDVCRMMKSSSHHWRFWMILNFEVSCSILPAKCQEVSTLQS